MNNFHFLLLRSIALSRISLSSILAYFVNEIHERRVLLVQQLEFLGEVVKVLEEGISVSLGLRKDSKSMEEYEWTGEKISISTPIVTLSHENPSFCQHGEKRKLSTVHPSLLFCSTVVASINRRVKVYSFSSFTHTCSSVSRSKWCM